jgi:hypothetical protein
MAADEESKASPTAAKAAAQKEVSPPDSEGKPADAGSRPSPFRNQAPARPSLTIPAGTQLSVRLDQTLDTKRTRPGDHFSAILDAPITVRGRVIVPSGTIFEGHVTQAKASGRLRGRGVLGLTLDSFRLHGAKYTVLTAANISQSGDHKKRNVALIGGGAGAGAVLGKVTGVGAAIGAGAGAAAGTTTALITGKRNVKLPVETPLVFPLRRRVDIRG